MQPRAAMLWEERQWPIPLRPVAPVLQKIRKQYVVDALPVRFTVLPAVVPELPAILPHRRSDITQPPTGGFFYPWLGIVSGAKNLLSGFSIKQTKYNFV